MIKGLAFLCTAAVLAAQEEAPLTLEISGVGTAVVQPGQDPADAVESFTQQANAAGHNLDGAAMTQMMEFFCQHKTCVRTELVVPAPEQPISLEIKGVGTAVVQPGQDPADAVEEFVTQANAAGHSIDGEGMMQMMEYFCSQKTCVRTQLVQPAVAQPITLEVSGVGTAVVQPGVDPADAVEAFAAQANAAGHSIDGEGMVQMMEVRDKSRCPRCSRARADHRTPPHTAPQTNDHQHAHQTRTPRAPQYFCKQTACRRMQLVPPPKEQPVTLEISGVGTAVVQPGQDPADAVEDFTSQAIAAGHEITGEGMTQMMEYVPSRARAPRISHQSVPPKTGRPDASGQTPCPKPTPSVPRHSPSAVPCLLCDALPATPSEHLVSLTSAPRRLPLLSAALRRSLAALSRRPPPPPPAAAAARPLPLAGTSASKRPASAPPWSSLSRSSRSPSRSTASAPPSCSRARTLPTRWRSSRGRPTPPATASTARGWCR
jgi:hypothetical protein